MVCFNGDVDVSLEYCHSILVAFVIDYEMNDLLRTVYAVLENCLSNLMT